MKTKVLCYVNPMKGWGNNPDAYIVGRAPRLFDEVYHVTEGCYWHQGEVTERTHGSVL